MSAAADAIAPVGRSLWADARIRLFRNKAAVASLFFLVFMVLLAIVGPWLSPHSYDRVYTEYVRTPASLTAYPKPDQIEPAVTRVASRLRAQVESQQVSARSCASRSRPPGRSTSATSCCSAAPTCSGRPPSSSAPTRAGA